jgi:hypothetical protein
MCVPMKYDPTSKKKLFIAIRKDSALRVLGEYSLVIVRKIGLPPRCFSQPRPNSDAPARRFSTEIDWEIVASLGKMCDLLLGVCRLRLARMYGSPAARRRDSFATHNRHLERITQHIIVGNRVLSDQN